MRQRLICSVAAILLVSAAFSPAVRSATPAMGTLTTASGPITYTSQAFLVSNASATTSAQAGGSIQCTPAQLFPCDMYTLTVTVPTDYATSHPYDTVSISMAFPPTPQEDFDLYLYDSTGATLLGQSSTTNNPEVISFKPTGGTTSYIVEIVPTTAAGDMATTTISLVAGSAPPTVQPFVGLSPRFQNYLPPIDGVTGIDSSGEASIGYNPTTGNILVLADLKVYRITPPEKLAPALPESCDAHWRDVSFVTEDQTTLDPILWTDQGSGRTFIVQQTTGAGLLFAHTDDDGANWVPLAAAPPDGGVDHETVGTGPYPAGSTFATVAQAAGVNYATYYCSQGDAPAFCQRSDDGGVSFGPGTAIYNGVTSHCSSLHGHVRVAPNGAAYVPTAICGAEQGGSVSTDAGVTSNEFLVPGTTGTGGIGSDPSIGLASDNTAYYCTQNMDGHAVASVSHDNGTTWSTPYDLGASLGVVNTAFPEAFAGDPDRASCGFLGTTTAGNSQSLDFKGVWYAYIATTYDGGKTWTTVNATPNDAVQGYGGIWLQGGGNQNRNLLDFNETTIGDKGRILYAYNKGCVGPCLQDPSMNGFVADLRVVRQSGGRGLLAKFDQTEPATPNQSCLTGTRDTSASHLSWAVPDNGGADITNYKIYRSTASGGESYIGQTGNAKNVFVDTSSGATVPTYYYTVKGVNSQGDGVYSNEIVLPIGTTGMGNICLIPGISLLTDNSGDATTQTMGTNAVPGSDLLSFSLTQPYATDGNIKLAFRINTDAGQTPQPAGSSWYVSLKAPDGSVHGVHMTWAAGASTPTFESYLAGASPSGVTDGSVVTSGSTKPADASSGYDAPGGQITIVVALADLGLKPGDLIGGFNSGVTEAVGAIVQPLDSMPDSLAYTGNYTVNANAVCAPSTPPTALLSAVPTSGTSPLTVAFDGSGSSESAVGDSVVSYTFDFNDGSATVTQSTPTVSHTYVLASGATQTNYKPSLTVTNTHGTNSTNAAFAVIQVTSAAGTTTGGTTGGTTGVTTGGTTGSLTGGLTPGGTAPTPSNGRLGGAFGLGALLPLLAAAGLRRRRRLSAR